MKRSILTSSNLTLNKVLFRLVIMLIVLPVLTNTHTYAQANKTLSQANTTGTHTATQSITLAPGFSSSAPFRAYIANTFAACTTLLSSPSSSQNYILSSTIRVEGITDLSQISGKSTCEVNQVVQYFDGLGRPLQTINIQGSPSGKDMVQPVVYDGYGREATKYLPYTETSNGGTFRSSPLSTQATFYSGSTSGVVSTAYPFSQTVFEASPMNRVLEQGAPGASWQPYSGSISGSGHTVKPGYESNATNEVKLWVLVSGGASTSAAYGAGQLYKSTVRDENWSNTDNNAGIVEEFKDKEGKVILKRVWKDSSNALSTYYVYDDWGNLRYVIPPGVSQSSFTESDAHFLNFIYAYHYDGRNRVIEKKIPGKGWEYMVYNKLDKLILSQDANQRAGNVWLFTKYDVLGRPVMTGTYSDASSRATLQTSADALSTLWEQRDNANSSGTGTGYTNATMPASNIAHYLTISYFDDYDFYGNTFGQPSGGAQVGASQTRGLPTGSKIFESGGSNALLTVNYYDEEGRILQSKGKNHLGGEDIIDNTWNFSGELTNSTRTHTVSSTVTTIATRLDYDHTGRKLATTKNINGQATETIVSREFYNETGQLQTKKLHSTDGGSNFIQDIDYAYNERGWLTQINDPNSVTSSKIFGMQLTYANKADAFNGNIGSLSWQTKVPGGLGLLQQVQGYEYTYDKLNRLTLADYSSSGKNDHFNEGLAYDDMGNITSLTRTNSGSGYLNNLTYDYTSSGTGNKLWGVSDAGAEGYTGTYTYDVNGNVKTDTKKGITNIDYNYLNLPNTITRSAGNLTYLYDAMGTKLSRIAGGVTRHYLDGIEYNGSTIEFIQTEEGRAVNNSGTYSYEYFLKDHLGNTRATVKQDGSIVQVQDYYAFGREMNPGNSYSPSPDQAYKYNGKELQPGIEQLDYGARFYNTTIGRWNTVDPSAENDGSFSPYIYAFNSPVRFTDPDGRWPSEGDDPPGNGASIVENVLLDIRDRTTSGLVTVGTYIGSLFSDDVKVQKIEWSYGADGRQGRLVPIEGNKHIGAALGALDVTSSVPTGGPAAFLTKSPGTKAAAAQITRNALQGTPSLEKQAQKISSELNKGKNSVTIGTTNKQIRYDLAGKSHAGVPTPHKQVYNKNIVNGEVKNISRASKQAQPMTQQEIRAIRKWLEKQP